MTVTAQFLPALTQGAVLMASLIIALGAQNVLVLRQGLARQHVAPVVSLCIVSDVWLAAAGVFGMGALITASPVWMEVFRWGGAAFLLLYGWQAAHRAWNAQGAMEARQVQQPRALGPTLASALAVTYLNPHVYLDTVVLVGAVGAQLPAVDRPAFTAGAGLASMVWFSVLGYGASALAPVLQRPAVWRALDAAIAALMWTLAAQLLLRPIAG